MLTGAQFGVDAVVLEATTLPLFVVMLLVNFGGRAVSSRFGPNERLNVTICFSVAWYWFLR